MNKSTTEKKNIKDYIIDNALIIALLITIIGIIIIEPSFLQWRVVTDIMTQSAVKLICALGLMFPLLLGGTAIKYILHRESEDFSCECHRHILCV